jgi:hypothetical protein
LRWTVLFVKGGGEPKQKSDDSLEKRIFGGGKFHMKGLQERRAGCVERRDYAVRA